MRKFLSLTLIFLLYISHGAAFADDYVVPTPTTGTLGSGSDNSKNQYNQMMEKCKVVDNDGNGLIKAYMADSGVNLEGDPDAWIWVPYGQCKKINAGDFTNISPDILAKINTTNVQQAGTLGD